MSDKLQITSPNLSGVEEALVKGDLSKLSLEQRGEYYNSICSSLGLNPLTRPFDYIILNGKLTLYARKDATDQLRKTHGVSITKLEFSTENGVYIVVAHAQDSKGKVDADMGAVNIANLKGDALVNAYLKAVTKAKRRVTLSIVGLGMLDETEIDTIKKEKDITPPNTNTGNYLPTKPEKEQPIPEQEELFAWDWENYTAAGFMGVLVDLISNLETEDDMFEYEKLKEANKASIDKFKKLHRDKALELLELFNARKKQIEQLKFTKNE